jgi:hypothetical protein
MTVQWHSRSGLELDHVDHRSLAEQRAAGDAFRELERTYLVEMDERWFHGRKLYSAPKSA